MVSRGSQPLFHTIIDRLPLRPVNCTTFVTTKVMASEISHPLHIKTQRKIANFDPQGFYWRVNCPNDISRKAVVRNVCKGEFKKAFVWALAEAGWGKDGRPLDPGSKKGRLTGAVLMNIPKDPERVLKAKKADLRRDAGDVVRKIMAKQEQTPAWKHRPRQFDRSTRTGSGRPQISQRSSGDLQRSMAEATTGPATTKFLPTGSEP